MTETMKSSVFSHNAMRSAMRMLALALCCFICCAFILVGNADIAYCADPTEPIAGSPTDDAGAAIESAVEEMTDRIYQTMRSIIMPCTAIGFGAAGFMFLLGGSQGTEKARRVIVASCAGLILVIFAPLFAQAVATWFASSGGGGLSSYNPL